MDQLATSGPTRVPQVPFIPPGDPRPNRDDDDRVPRTEVEPDEEPPDQWDDDADEGLPGDDDTVND